MKKLILLLFIPLLFACSSGEDNLKLDDRIVGKYFIYEFPETIDGITYTNTGVNKPVLNGENSYHRWEFYANVTCWINFINNDPNYQFISSSEDVLVLENGSYYVTYTLLSENPLTLDLTYSGTTYVMEEISLNELNQLLDSKPDGCCNEVVTDVRPCFTE